VRVGRDTEKAGKGYFEDRRPASNMDPYVVTSMIAETTILWKPWATTPALCLFLWIGIKKKKGTVVLFLIRIWSFISHLFLGFGFLVIVVVRLLGALLVATTNYQGFFIAFHFFPMFSDCYNNIINNHIIYESVFSSYIMLFVSWKLQLWDYIKLHSRCFVLFFFFNSLQAVFLVDVLTILVYWKVCKRKFLLFMAGNLLKK